MASTRHTPFVSASASRAPSARHGSAEQEPRRDVFGRPYDNQPPPRTRRSFTAPGTPRVRSPSERNHRSHSRERRERQRRDGRRDSDTQGEPPTGYGTRLLTVERTMREHNNELASVKLVLDQLGKHFEGMQTWKISHKTRLDQSFAEWKIHLAENTKSNTEMIQSVQQNFLILGERVAKIESQIQNWAGNSAGPTSAPPQPPPGFGQPTSGIPEHFNVGSPPKTGHNGAPWSPLNDPWSQHGPNTSGQNAAGTPNS